MGTRGLTCVIRQAKPVVAQYWGYDNYPENAGVELLRRCQKLSDSAIKENFCTWLDKCKLLTEEEFAEFTKNVTSSGMYSRPILAEVASQLYMTGFDLLDWIMDSHAGPLEDSYVFAADSLFCEWCYVIDLDKNTFEVYQGFNHKPLPEGERFADLPKDDDYYPVKLLTSYSLDSLPTEEQFLKDNTESEDDE